MLDSHATERAFGQTVAAVSLRRDVVQVEGPDAGSYLHGQLSQNVLALAVGSSIPTLLLAPQGKVDAWLRLSRLGDDRYWLDVEPGFGSAVLQRLARFKLRVTLELTLLSDQPMISVRGPGSQAGAAALGFVVPPGGAILDWTAGSSGGSDGSRSDDGGFTSRGFDVIGPDAVIPADVPTGPIEALEALRIRLGLPAMGLELDESTIPAAAGIVEQSVDFTKGCYVGQELVARIDSRGNNTPTHLRGLRLDQAAELNPGAEIVQGSTVVGHLTSYAPGTLSGPIALGYLKRSVAIPSRASVTARDGQVVGAELVALPFE